MNPDKKVAINALVVDDNEVNNMVLSNMLEHYDINVDQADHGMAAVLMSKTKHYDIIFIDHIMPDMDGAETAISIRNQTSGEIQPAIVILTSNTFDNIKDYYKTICINGFYSKPLEALELSSLLKRCLPNEKFEEKFVKQEQSRISRHDEYIREIMKDISEIDYAKGLICSNGNPIQYLRILEVSLKDLQTSINIMVNCFENNSKKHMLQGIHKLKSIVGNIGAVALANKMNILEKIILEGDKNSIKLQYISFMKELNCFEERLRSFIEKYYAFIKSTDEDQVFERMPRDEYEQCIIKTIYYISRYEYDAVVQGLKLLMLQGCPRFKGEYEKALEDIKNYEYESAMARVLEIKNKTVNLPVQTINKMIQLESFWDEI